MSKVWKVLKQQAIFISYSFSFPSAIYDYMSHFIYMKIFPYKNIMFLSKYKSWKNTRSDADDYTELNVLFNFFNTNCINVERCIDETAVVEFLSSIKTMQSVYTKLYIYALIYRSINIIIILYVYKLYRSVPKNVKTTTLKTSFELMSNLVSQSLTR